MKLLWISLIAGLLHSHDISPAYQEISCLHGLPTGAQYLDFTKHDAVKIHRTLFFFNWQNMWQIGWAYEQNYIKDSCLIS